MRTKVGCILLSLALIFCTFNFASLASTSGNQSDKVIYWDFENGNISNWETEDPSDMAITTETVGINNTALRLNHTFNDKTALTWWDKAGIRLTQKMDVSEYKAVVFDVILDASAIDGYGAIIPYACIHTEGWKEFIHLKAGEIPKLPDEDTDRNQLVKIKLTAALPENTSVIEQLVIWVVGGAVDYSRPIYVDNIGFSKTIEETPETEKIITAENSPVSKYGKLHVEGTKLCAEDGTEVQLTGMSIPVLYKYPEYLNRNVFQCLAYDWKCDVVRIAISVGENAYTGTKEQNDLIGKAIDLAIENGIYILLDWHVLTPGDPLDSAYAGAGDFFELFSSQYKDCPNLIYEVCNEPNGNITWEDNIKPYAESMIEIIRKNSPDSVIVVGSGTWSQDVRDPADDPIDADNIMYTVHFYSGTHKQSLRDSVSYALSKNIAIFATEWGMTLHTGADGIYLEETELWIEFLKENKISWTNWSLNDSAAESSVLRGLVTVGEENGLVVKGTTTAFPRANENQPFAAWSEGELNFSGKYIRNLIRSYHDYEMIFESKELKIDSLDVSESEDGTYQISVKASGGKGTYKYSYYFLKAGVIYSPCAYTVNSQINFVPTENGTYTVRVYVQDSLNKRCVEQYNLTV